MQVGSDRGIETFTTKKSNPTRKAAARITARDFHRPGSGGSIAAAARRSGYTGRTGADGTFIADLLVICFPEQKVPVILHRSLIHWRERCPDGTTQTRQDCIVDRGPHDDDNLQLFGGTSEGGPPRHRHPDPRSIQFRPGRRRRCERTGVPVRCRAGCGPPGASGRREVRHRGAGCHQPDPSFLHSPPLRPHAGISGRDADVHGWSDAVGRWRSTVRRARPR